MLVKAHNMQISLKISPDGTAAAEGSHFACGSQRAKTEMH